MIKIDMNSPEFQARMEKTIKFTDKVCESRGWVYNRIFCTPEFAAAKKIELGMEEIVHTHSRGLTKDECEVLVNQAELDGDELTALIEARELGMVNFTLVDVREHMEWQMGHIKGADKLVPTSSFYQAVEDAKLNKDENIILYCHVGSRSAHVARIMPDMGYTKIGNLTHGIVSFSGEVER